MPKLLTNTKKPSPPRPKPEPEFLVFGKPSITEAEIQAVTDVLRSGWIGTGRITRELEEQFAAQIGVGYAVAVSSCTMALMLSMIVSNIGEGKEVITSPLTFAATVNAILAVGAKPVFVDVDPHGNLDPEKIRFAITDKTRGIIPIHYTGAPCDMGRILANARQFDLKVIEDTAHGWGGSYVELSNGDKPAFPRPLGTLGDFGCFSFYATKNVTGGEGGMIVTRRGDLAERIRILANQGQSAGAWGRYTSGPILPHEVVHAGHKGNLPDILSSLVLTQLKRWPELRAKRAAIWKIYEDNFGVKEMGHSQHLFTTRVKNRDQFRQKMWELGIGTGVHYRPLHMEPAYKYLGYKQGDFPQAEKIGEQTVSLPVSATMTPDDAQRVVDAVKLIREAVDEV